MTSLVINDGDNVNITGKVRQLVALSGVTTVEGIVDSVVGAGTVVRRSGSVVSGIPTE
jgi:hypothetical protein